MALILGLVAALAWGLHDLLVRRISPGSNVLGQILAVFATAAVVLLALGGHEILTLTAGSAVLAASAGLAYVLAYVGMFRAFGLAPVRVVSPILAAYPLLTLLITAAQGQTVTLADWAAVALVVAGVCLVAALAEGDSGSPASTRAALGWAALGALGLATTFALGQAANVGQSAASAGAVTRLAAVLATMALILWQRPSLDPVRQHWRTLLLMGVLDTVALGLVMLAGGLAHAEYAAITASLFGVVTILLAWRFLSEAVRPAQWLGVTLVFAGVIVLAV